MTDLESKKEFDLSPGQASDERQADALLKSVLVLQRSIEIVLGSHAVESAVKKPLSDSKVDILRLLLHQGKRTQGEIASFLGVSSPAASQLAGSLLRQKLVTRKTDRKDRRIAYLSLSAKGKRFIQAITAEQKLRLTTAMKQASNEECMAWSRTLNQIARALSVADTAIQKSCMQCGAHREGHCLLPAGPSHCEFLEKLMRQTDRAAV